MYVHKIEIPSLNDVYEVNMQFYGNIFPVTCGAKDCFKYVSTIYAFSVLEYVLFPSMQIVNAQFTAVNSTLLIDI